MYAGRDWHTDQGQHTFDFTLCADQNLEAGRLNKLTRQQAQPPAVFDRYEGLDRPPWGTARRAPCGSPQSNARWPTERCLTSRNRDPASRGLRRGIVCEQRRSPLNIAPLQEDTRK